MKLITDNPDFCGTLFPADYTPIDSEQNNRYLPSRLLCEKKMYSAENASLAGWRYGLVVEKAVSSQYDILCESCKQNDATSHALFCFAGSGTNFHGQRKRPWSSPPGNIYLSVHFAPHVAIEGFAVGLPILAAVSVIETIDLLPGLSGKAGIKWVNDIFIESKKISGFLAFNQHVQGVVSNAILGIGINVLTRPEVPVDPFVKGATALIDHCNDKSLCTQRHLLPLLLKRIWYNYELLLAGQYRTLLDSYRERSIIIGKQVKIVSDPLEGEKLAKTLAEGKVTSIGNNLEIFIEGQTQPITQGRLILKTL